MLLRVVFFPVFIAFFVVNVYGVAEPAAAGRLIEYKIERQFSKESLSSFFKEHKIPRAILPVREGIDIYEILYYTKYADSSLVTASGLVYVPVSRAEALPTLLYNHGTEMCKERSCSFTGEQSICLAFATDNYIVVCPDYVGMGKGEHDQLYLHANTEAQASVDMLTAVSHLLTFLNVKRNKHLFVTGYSQGGHAAMATTRLLQESYSNMYPVTASAPMSGPYDLENTVYNGRNHDYVYPGFFFLLLKSYMDSEGKADELSGLLNSPYDSLIPPMLDGEHTVQQVGDYIPDTVFSAVKPEFYSDFVSNPDNGFRKFLRKQNVYNWKPEMPMLLSYCDGDEEVTYQNTITAYETMKKNGSKTVHLRRAGKKFGHVNCALFAVIYSKMYIDSFRTSRPGHHGPYFKRLLLNIGKLFVKAN